MGNCGEFHTFTVAYYNKVMIRFLGNIEARADAKGRVFIPATFRKQLQAASEERLIMRKDVFQDWTLPIIPIIHRCFSFPVAAWR